MSAEKQKKKLVVFDRFDWNPDPDMHRTLNLQGEIDPDRHEVIAHANDLGRAAAILLAIKDGEIDLPDVIVIGGILEGQDEYELNPHVMSTEEQGEKEDKPKRGIRGLGKKLQSKVQDKLQEAQLWDPPEGPLRQYLLPVVDEHGNVTLPEASPQDTSYPGIAKDRQEIAILKHKVAMYDNEGIDAPAGYTLSHLANHLLNADGKKVKIIGHSNVPRHGYGKNAPLDAFVRKVSNPGTLRAEIDKADESEDSTPPR